jgi:uncharacterized repeat protein (TIGR03803 family)
VEVLTNLSSLEKPGYEFELTRFAILARRTASSRKSYTYVRDLAVERQTIANDSGAEPIRVPKTSPASGLFGNVPQCQQCRTRIISFGNSGLQALTACPTGGTMVCAWQSRIALPLAVCSRADPFLPREWAATRFRTTEDLPMTRFSAWKMACITLLLCTAMTVAAPAQTFTTIANFGDNPGSNPEFTALVQGPDGGLYGTTANQEDGGTVFRVGTDGTLSFIYSFCSLPKCVDGDVPYAGVIVGTDGNLYGVTSSGGAYGNGTVFRLTLSGTLATLYSFCSQLPCTDGRDPFGGLVEDTDGNFYGTTAAGGLYDDGTIFKITLTGIFETLYSFCAEGFPCPDGYSPEASLTEGTDGNLYGSTFGGGGEYRLGTLFKITPSGSFTALWDFSTQGGGDGPLAPLTLVSNGDFVGTTAAPNGHGTIFNVTSQGKLTLLHTFLCQRKCLGGNAPEGALALGTDGKLYGTTSFGGIANCPLGCGTIFQAQRGEFSTLYRFCSQTGCPDGYDPLGGLMQATNGVFYGTTSVGGANRGGTVFSLDNGAGALREFYSFRRAKSARRAAFSAKDSQEPPASRSTESLQTLRLFQTRSSRPPFPQARPPASSP